MRRKTAYLISCSDHYSHRLNVIADHLREKSYEVTYITSDFDHVSKKKFQCTVPEHVQIHARPYRKNLSCDRILSHRGFARDVFKYLSALPHEPSVVVALLPPNFLAYYAAAYKKKHPKVKLIFDIFDMWPEAFPSATWKKLLAPVFYIWARIRDCNLYAADFITTECDLFREKLHLSNDQSQTVYLCNQPLSCGIYPADLADDRLELCYLGSINNIIGIEEICDLIKKLVSYKPVTLHIIGSGERMQELIDMAGSAGAFVVCHGAIYEEEKKQEIMSRCHFGLNIMKPTVCLGLTMKSVDYFRNGLPIISNVSADTKMLLQRWNAGIQMDACAAERIAGLSVAEMAQMRCNVRSMFDFCFDRKVIDDQYGYLLRDFLRGNYEEADCAYSAGNL